MKPIIAATFVLLSLSIINPVFAQKNTKSDAGIKIPGATSVRMNAEGTAPSFVTFEPSKAFKISELETLKKHLFGSRPEDSWQEIRSEADDLGMVHTRYQQYYQGLPVEGNVYIFHSRGEKIVSANGYFTPGITLSVSPTISADAALELAASGMKQPVQINALEQTGTELLIALTNGKAHLAYKCQLFGREPYVNVAVYIDANSGAILQENNLFCAIDANGTAHTQFSGVRSIVTDSLAPNQFQLRESGRGNGIETLAPQPQNPYSDTDNDWNNVNATLDEYATDVHFGTEVTYDFYYNNFGRNSYDNLGAVLRSHVNAIGAGATAYWAAGYDNTTNYGAGDADHYPFASLEIVGHEQTHAYTEYTAGLIYADESGSLNESFSDIFGATIRFLTDTASGSWQIGDQLLHPGAGGPPALRNMANPNQYMCADTYGGVFFNNADIVHFDSGIQNFWYYLLVEGGSGSNDFGNAYNVSSIGLEDAMKIAYRNLVYYLTPSSTFLDARAGAEQAAVDLFGACSNQHLQVAEAWYAVGVGPDVTTIEAEAAFTSDNNFGCTAPVTTTFHGVDGYQSYSWNFGDGTTSSLQHPSHTYTSSGNYAVTLIVFNNNAICQQPDTILIQNAVVIALIDPVAGFVVTTTNQITGLPVNFEDTSLYGPLSWEWNFGDGTTSTQENPVHTYPTAGIYSVQLIVHNCHGVDTIVQQVDVVDAIVMCQATYTEKPQGLIYDSGGPNGNYGNNEFCGLLIRPCHASAITLSFDSLSLEGPDVLIVYDGTDDIGVILAYVTSFDHPDPVTATEGAMYILFDSDPGTTYPGYKLHYTSELNGYSNSESANFYADTTNGMGDILVGDTVYINPGYIRFYDRSTQDPYSWEWNFDDGTTEQVQNPGHVFLTDGYYTVTLTVTFCDGTTDSYDLVVAVGSAGITELSGKSLLTIAPNPFQNQFTIGTGELLHECELRLLDFSGRVVYSISEPVISSEGIVVSPGLLSTGQYLLEARYLDNHGTQGFERHKIEVVQE